MFWMEVEREGSPSYYSVLGVGTESSLKDIKTAYHRLALQWHPDRWTRTPSLLTEAKRKFQLIQEAYSVLSDQKKRTMYDIGLYDPRDDEEEGEGYSDFLQEMLSLMAYERRQNKTYSMEELQTMFTEMVQGFQYSVSYCENSELDQARDSKKRRYDSKPMVNCGGGQLGMPSWGLCSSFCK